MKLTKVVMLVVVAATLAFVSCKPKDADIQAKIEEAIKADPMMSGASVSVKDGVATLSGEVKDDACKAYCEKTIGAIKGVKSPIVNNCTVPAPAPVVAPPASLTTVMDAKVIQALKDGMKDIKGITVDYTGAKPVISGTVTTAERMKIMQIFSSAKIIPDVTKLISK